MKYSGEEIKHRLLLEFKNIKFKKSLLDDVNYIAVLSAEEVTLSGENGERFLQVFNLVKNDRKKTIIFLGTKLHNLNLEKFLKREVYLCKIVILGSRSDSTTKIQIKQLSSFLGKHRVINKILIVSNTYHFPRIKRYCRMYLNSKVRTYYIGIGDIRFQTQRVDDEIEKIIKYASKKDLPLLI